MASLADAYKPNRRAGMEHSPRPINPWPAVDRAAASLASYIPSPTQGRRMSMDEAGNVYGSTAEENQLSSLVDFLAGTGAAPTAMARQTPGLLNAIGVWHGSPHKFERFDLSKIGTGEGAQAFGHGIYTAENKNIAQGYADTLTKSFNAMAQATPKIDGEAFDLSLAGGRAAQIPSKGFDAVRAELADLVERSKSAKPPKWAYKKGREQDLAGILADNQKTLEIHQGWLDELDSIKDRNVEWLSPNLYKVSLEWPDPAREAADPLGPHHFLDWDSDLGQQSDYVRKALGLKDMRTEGMDIKAFKDYRDAMRDKYQGGLHMMTPDERAKYDALFKASENSSAVEGAFNARPASMFYHGNHFADDAEASRKLLELGIPGIRYLDSGSRTAGDGTRNYVVFQDSLAKILERNGIPVGR